MRGSQSTRVDTLQARNVVPKFCIRKMDSILAKAFPDLPEFVTARDSLFDLGPKQCDLGRFEFRLISS